MQTCSFELLELPDGRWCVARIAASETGLVAGSFAAPGHQADTEASAASPTPGHDPVGIFATRDAAERAIDRATPAPASPLAPFARWLSAP